MSGCSEHWVAGRFRVQESLGSGKFGTVFRATQMVFDRPLREVALKISRARVDPSEAEEAFADAIVLSNAIDQCQDPLVRQGLVQVFDVGICDQGDFDGRAYCAMELSRGGTFRDRLRGNTLPLAHATDYALSIIRTVAFMHGGVRDDTGRLRPIIHRDIKPSNILMSPCVCDGVPVDQLKLADFGLAVYGGQLTGGAPAGGTLSYMAPEALIQNHSSTAGDVYALGLLLYEMLTGTHPFSDVVEGSIDSGPEAHRNASRLHEAARRQESFGLLAHNRELDEMPELKMVVRRALAFDDADRYPDAGALKADFERVLGEKGESVLAVPKMPPRDRVIRLLKRARRLRLGGDEPEAARRAAEDALLIDREQVGDSRSVGEVYLLLTEMLLDLRDDDTALELASEGYRRRQSWGTCAAMRAVYSFRGSALAAAYETRMKQHSPEVI